MYAGGRTTNVYIDCVTKPKGPHFAADAQRSNLSECCVKLYSPEKHSSFIFGFDF